MPLKFLTITLAATILAAVLAAPAAGAPPAAAPATRPALPGGDIDLRSACAVAGSVVVGEAGQVDAERSMQAFDGTYASGQVAVARQLKGKPAGESVRVYLPVSSDKRPGVQLPQKGTRYVFFLWSDGLGDPRAIKVEPETPEVVRQVEGLLADQARAHAATQPAAAVGKPVVDLAASIVVPAGQRVQGGWLPATLRLTNRGLLPVRVCTRGGEWSSAHGKGSDVNFTPGRYKSDSPPAYDFARHVVELAPGASADVPVRFAMQGVGVPRLSASYEVGADVGAMLDVWSGTATAEPVGWAGRP